MKGIEKDKELRKTRKRMVRATATALIFIALAFSVCSTSAQAAVDTINRGSAYILWDADGGETYTGGVGGNPLARYTIASGSAEAAAMASAVLYAVSAEAKAGIYSVVRPTFNGYISAKIEGRFDVHLGVDGLASTCEAYVKARIVKPDAGNEVVKSLTIAHFYLAAAGYGEYPGMINVLLTWYGYNQIDYGVELYLETYANAAIAGAAFADAYGNEGIWQEQLTVWSTPTCSALAIPSGGMHFNSVSDSTYGEGYKVDTIGYYSYGYNFMAVTGTYTTSSYGTVQVEGYFSQYDTFSPSLQPGRRLVYVYVVDASTNSIIHSTKVLDHNDPVNTWIWNSCLIGGLPANTNVKIGVGRPDAWSTDYQLTASFTQLHVEMGSNVMTVATTIPSGHYCNKEVTTTAYGATISVNTGGSYDYGYDFMGRIVQYSTITVPSDGKIYFQGKFAQYDTFPQNEWPGRRMVEVYIMDKYGTTEIASQIVLNENNAVNTWYTVSGVFTGLTAGQTITFGVGRPDAWYNDYWLTATWTDLIVSTCTIT